MRIRQARYVILRNFFPTNTCLPSAEDARNEYRENFTYSSAPNSKSKLTIAFPRAVSLPVILDSHGAVWREANYYLYTKFVDLEISRSTYKSIAKDLSLFKRYLEEEEIDLNFFPENKLMRVTYRYRFYISSQVNRGELSPSTGRRRISSVVGFYRWLIKKKIILPENSAWEEREKLIVFTDRVGMERYKRVQTTDLSMSVPEIFDFETISDGGRLRPLSESELLDVLKALSVLHNPEMALAHFIAIFTGARLQTVLTLRTKNVQRSSYVPYRLYQVPVGNGTGVDTKNGKRFTLLIPGWLMETLWHYCRSERARLRREKFKGKPFLGRDYIFLTNRGAPYYQSIQDDDAASDSSEGSAVGEYIRSRVLKFLGSGFRYSFHDLRATFSMNLMDQMEVLIERGEIKLEHAREYLMLRLGHSNARSADNYLKFRRVSKLIRSLQDKYEDRLEFIAASMVAENVQP